MDAFAADPSMVPPEGALCAEHPDRLAASVCNRCGLFLCSDCARPHPEGGAYCLACGERVAPRFSVPWETRTGTGQGLVSAWWRTCLDISLRPDRTLRGVGGGPVAPALLFGAVTETVGMVFYLPFSLAMQLVNPSLGESERLLLIGMSAGTLVLTPLLATVGFFLGAALLLPFLRLMGGQGSYAATVRGMAYATAPMVFYVVPCVGWAIGAALMLASAVYSQKHVHRISGWHVVGAWGFALLVLMVALGLLIGAAAGLVALLGA